MNKRSALTPAVMLLISVLFAGCKIQITVPEGGDVGSVSGSYDCASGMTCTIEVNDFYFSEDFIANPWQEWVFMGWKQGHRFLCQSQREACHLSTVGFEDNDVLSSIVESDETFYLEPEFIRGTPIEQALAQIEDDELLSCLRSWIDEHGPFQFAEELTWLQCGGDYKSLEGIQAFIGLKKLELDSIEDTAISWEPLAGLVRLNYLAINGSSISNVAKLVHPLAAMTELMYLDISESDIADLTPLTDTLAKLKRLKSLDLQHNLLVDLNPLAGLNRLRSINLLGNIFLEDISALAGLTQLEILDIRATSVEDIGPLAGLARLQRLRISSSIHDISPLSGLTELRALILWADLDDIAPLAGLTKLTFLDLSRNDIRDIRPLAGLIMLRFLDLSGNRISDISTLAGMTKLTDLNLMENRISVIGDSLDFMTAGDVYLSGNPISCDEASRLRADESEPTVHYWPLPEDLEDIPPDWGISLDCT